MSARVPSNEADSAPADPAAAAQNDGAAATAGTVLYGIGAAAKTHATVIWLPDPGPANDALADDSDALLAADPEFDAVCDARRDAWIASSERHAHTDAAGTRPPTDEEHDDERT